MAEEGGVSTVNPEGNLSGDLTGDELGEGLESSSQEESRTTPRSEEELQKLQRLAREHQARADRAEAALKEIERSQMGDVERMRAELEDEKAARQQIEAAYYQVFLEAERDRMAEEAEIPKELRQFIPTDAKSEGELREKVQAFAAGIKQFVSAPGSPPEETAEEPEKGLPFVPSGTPQRAEAAEAEVSELLAQGAAGDREAIRAALKKKLFRR